MKQSILFAALLIAMAGKGQELFSVTEPASTRPSRSIGFRVDNLVMDETGTAKTNYHLIPELMIGVSQKLTVMGNIFFSNRRTNLGFEGGSVYAKFRFLSRDDMQRHFRMAAFARIGINNSDVHQEEININGHNSGWEGGIIATQLLKKVALSGTVSYVRADDNAGGNKFLYGGKNKSAINTSLSIGKLMLPKVYRDFKQVNLNLMAEVVSQVNTGSGKYFVEVVPVVQLILNSQARVDIGYKQEIASTMLRTAPNGFIIRFEYNLFNAF